MARFWTGGLFNWIAMNFLVALISCKIRIIKGRRLLQRNRSGVTEALREFVYTNSERGAEDYLSAKAWRNTQKRK